jgi:hypothetical protein
VMASNIGSTTTITGNAQNIMIGSFSHIPFVQAARRRSSQGKSAQQRNCEVMCPCRVQSIRPQIPLINCAAGSPRKEWRSGRMRALVCTRRV